MQIYQGRPENLGEIYHRRHLTLLHSGVRTCYGKVVLQLNTADFINFQTYNND